MIRPLNAGELLLVRGYLDGLARNPDARQMVSADMARRLLATLDARDRMHDAIDDVITPTAPPRNR